MSCEALVESFQDINEQLYKQMNALWQAWKIG